MKKLLLIAVALGLAGMLAVPAMAADLTATGFIAVTGQAFKNLNMAAPLMMTDTYLNETGSFLAMRVRLGFTLRASEDLYGHVMFEVDSNRFGETAAGPESNNAGRFGADRIAVEVKNAYIDFRVPPKLPIWLRVGIQGYYIRPLVFMYADAAGVSARATIEPIKLNIAGYYAKVNDSDWWRADVGSEFYLADVNIPITFSPKASIKPGMFFGYQDIRMNGSAAWAGWLSGVSYIAIPNFLTAGVDDAQLWWLGLYANGKLGPVPMELDFIYQGGSQAAIASNPLTDFGGWLIRGWASYVWKNLEVGGGGMYVSGDDTATTDKYEGFILPANFSESPGITGDSVVFFGNWMNTNLNAHAGALVGPGMVWPGFWYARGFAYYKLFPWLKLGGQVMFLADTVTNSDFRYFNIANESDDDQNIGWEFDFGVNLQIYKNLSFNGAFGYLFAQKALSPAGSHKLADPWSFVGMLMYTF